MPAPGAASPGAQSRAERASRADFPDPCLLAAVAGACGVSGFTTQPAPTGTPGRVWLLRPDAPGATPAPVTDPASDRVLKLTPSALEVALLRAAVELSLPAPEVCAWVAQVGAAPVATAGLPPADARPTALCMTALPGLPLSAELHAGGAIPVAAWAETIARVHRVPTSAAAAAIPSLTSAPSPSRWCADQLPGLMAEAQRIGPVDVGLLLAAAAERLPGLAASAQAEPVLCHGDWSPEHVLVKRGSVTGVAGWAHGYFGPPAYDLATAVLGLFTRGLSVRAALALGQSLAAAYAAAMGTRPVALAFPLAAQAFERTVAAVSRRAAGRAGLDVAAWAGLLGVSLGAS